MYIYLVDNSLRVQVYYDETDQTYSDNICISIDEECPCEEKVLINDQTNLYITPEQAEQLGNALLMAARNSRGDKSEQSGAER